MPRIACNKEEYEIIQRERERERERIFFAFSRTGTKKGTAREKNFPANDKIFQKVISVFSLTPLPSTLLGAFAPSTPSPSMESAEPVDPYRVALSRALLGMVIWKVKARHMRNSTCCEGYLTKLLEENLEPLPAESRSFSSAGCEFTKRATRRRSRALRTEIRNLYPGTDKFNTALDAAITELAEEMKTWLPPAAITYMPYFSENLLDLVLSAAFQGAKKFNVAKLDASIYHAVLKVISDSLKRASEQSYGNAYANFSKRTCTNLHKMENALAFLPPVVCKEDAMAEMPRFSAELLSLEKDVAEAEEIHRRVAEEESAAAEAHKQTAEHLTFVRSQLHGEVWNRCNKVKRKLDDFKHKMYLHGVNEEMLKHAGELAPGASGYHRTGEHFRDINTPEGRKRIAEQPIEQERETKAAKV
jgi:hypothetical protein